MAETIGMGLGQGASHGDDVCMAPLVKINQRHARIEMKSTSLVTHVTGHEDGEQEEAIPPKPVLTQQRSDEGKKRKYSLIPELYQHPLVANRKFIELQD